MPKPTPPPYEVQDFIRGYMMYDPVQNAIVWAEYPPERQVVLGEPVGSIQRSRGRRTFFLWGHTIYMPAISCFLADGEWPKDRVWAIDGNPNNVKRSNLRIGPASFNGVRNAITPEELARRKGDPWGHVSPKLKETIESMLQAEYAMRGHGTMGDYAALHEWLRYKLAIFMGGTHDVMWHHEQPYISMSIEGLERRIELFS